MNNKEKAYKIVGCLSGCWSLEKKSEQTECTLHDMCLYDVFSGEIFQKNAERAVFATPSVLHLWSA